MDGLKGGKGRRVKVVHLFNLRREGMGLARTNIGNKSALMLAAREVSNTLMPHTNYPIAPPPACAHSLSSLPPLTHLHALHAKVFDNFGKNTRVRLDRAPVVRHAGGGGGVSTGSEVKRG